MGNPRLLGRYRAAFRLGTDGDHGLVRQPLAIAGCELYPDSLAVPAERTFSYEELETTNEELQSANEELETTNEELRSSNEELETTNIELKSASDALEHMNASLVHANNELNRFSALHRHVMDNFPSAVVVLDSHLLVEEWNRAATDLWGLREDEVLGEPFFGLDFGLPLDALQEPVRACRSPGAATVTLDLPAINRLGRSVTCRVVVVQAIGHHVPPSAMLIMQLVETDPA